MTFIQASILMTSVFGILAVLVNLSQENGRRKQEVVIKVDRKRNRNSRR